MRRTIRVDREPEVEAYRRELHALLTAFEKTVNRVSAISASCFLNSVSKLASIPLTFSLAGHGLRPIQNYSARHVRQRSGWRA